MRSKEQIEMQSYIVGVKAQLDVLDDVLRYIPDSAPLRQLALIVRDINDALNTLTNQVNELIVRTAPIMQSDTRVGVYNG